MADVGSVGKAAAPIRPQTPSGNTILSSLKSNIKDIGGGGLRVGRFCRGLTMAIPNPITRAVALAKNYSTNTSATNARTQMKGVLSSRTETPQALNTVNARITNTFNCESTSNHSPNTEFIFTDQTQAEFFTNCLQNAGITSNTSTGKKSVHENTHGKYSVFLTPKDEDNLKDKGNDKLNQLVALGNAPKPSSKAGIYKLTQENTPTGKPETSKSLINGSEFSYSSDANGINMTISTPVQSGGELKKQTQTYTLKINDDGTYKFESEHKHPSRLISDPKETTDSKEGTFLYDDGSSINKSSINENNDSKVKNFIEATNVLGAIMTGGSSISEEGLCILLKCKEIPAQFVAEALGSPIQSTPELIAAFNARQGRDSQGTIQDEIDLLSFCTEALSPPPPSPEEKKTKTLSEIQEKLGCKISIGTDKTSFTFGTSNSTTASEVQQNRKHQKKLSEALTHGSTGLNAKTSFDKFGNCTLTLTSKSMEELLKYDIMSGIELGLVKGTPAAAIPSDHDQQRIEVTTNGTTKHGLNNITAEFNIDYNSRDERLTFNSTEEANAFSAKLLSVGIKSKSRSLSQGIKTKKALRGPKQNQLVLTREELNTLHGHLNDPTFSDPTATPSPATSNPTVPQSLPDTTRMNTMKQRTTVLDMGDKHGVSTVALNRQGNTQISFNSPKEAEDFSKYLYDKVKIKDEGFTMASGSIVNKRPKGTTTNPNQKTELVLTKDELTKLHDHFNSLTSDAQPKQQARQYRALIPLLKLGLKVPVMSTETQFYLFKVISSKQVKTPL